MSAKNNFNTNTRKGIFADLLYLDGGCSRICTHELYSSGISSAKEIDITSMLQMPEGAVAIRVFDGIREEIDSVVHHSLKGWIYLPGEVYSLDMDVSEKITENSIKEMIKSGVSHVVLTSSGYCMPLDEHDVVYSKNSDKIWPIVSKCMSPSLNSYPK
jgi:hypothetical protein